MTLAFLPDCSSCKKNNWDKCDSFKTLSKKIIDIYVCLICGHKTSNVLEDKSDEVVLAETWW